MNEWEFDEEFNPVPVRKPVAQEYGPRHGLCRFNPSVNCDGKVDCKQCGWNPAVDKWRRVHTRSKLNEQQE